MLSNIGHTFCLACIQQLRPQQCPLCRQRFDLRQVQPNFALQQIIEDGSAAESRAPIQQGSLMNVSRPMPGAAEPVSATYVRLGAPPCLADLLAEEDASIALRVYLLDNSGSMARTDGSRLVPNSRGHPEMQPCSRWEELTTMAVQQAEWNRELGVPCEFVILNSPSPNIPVEGVDIFRVDAGQGDPRAQVQVLASSLCRTRPSGTTPLGERLESLRARLQPSMSEMARSGRKVTLTIATDGVPNSREGFVWSLRRLMTTFPINVVIRLCTSESEVCEFYNEVDKEVEMPLDIVDDLQGEADNVFMYNPWLTYSPVLHTIREAGTLTKVFDLLDERGLTPMEAALCAQLLLRGSGHPLYPRQPMDFLDALERDLHSAPLVFDVRRRRMVPPLDFEKVRAAVLPSRFSGVAGVVRGVGLGGLVDWWHGDLAPSDVVVPPRHTQAQLPAEDTLQLHAGVAPVLSRPSAMAVGHALMQAGHAPMLVGQNPMAVGQVPASINQAPMGVLQAPVSVGPAPVVAQAPMVLDQAWMVAGAIPMATGHAAMAGNQTPAAVSPAVCVAVSPVHEAASQVLPAVLHAPLASNPVMSESDTVSVVVGPDTMAARQGPVVVGSSLVTASDTLNGVSLPPGVQLSFVPGQRVEYFSVSSSRWLQCKVIAVDSSLGSITIDLKPEMPLTPGQVATQIRRHSEGLSQTQRNHEPVNMMTETIVPGKRLEYFSQNKGSWFPCTVISVDLFIGCVTIDLKPSSPLTAEEAKTRLRPITVSASVGPVSLDVTDAPQVGACMEYFSRNKGAWFPCVVMHIELVSGSVTIDLKPHAPLTAEEAGECLRSSARICSPLSTVAFGACPIAPGDRVALVVGQRMEYFSDSQRAWFPCVVTHVEPSTGAVTIDLKPRTPLSVDTARTALRPLKPTVSEAM